MDEHILAKILETLEEIRDRLPAVSSTAPAISTPVFESPAKFAKRTGYPERLITMMAKQGQLPHSVPKEKHIVIEIAGAIEVLKQYAGQTADEIAATLSPQTSYFREKAARNPNPPTEKKKSPGRRPDKLRLANKVSNG